jgi:hypothetical protein
MAREDVRVNLPVKDPDGTVKLCEKIFGKHTAMGVGSPLNGTQYDMVILNGKVALIKTKRADAETLDGQKQTHYKQALYACGFAAGQNLQSEGTLYSLTVKVRDTLLIKFRSNPETLEQWGFTVVVSQTGARRDVKVEIPRENPEELVTLATAIRAKHVLDGVGSPLNGQVDMVAFAGKLATAISELDSWNTKDASKQALHNDALVLLGYADGQTAQTEGTCYWFITGIRDVLLNKYEPNPEELSNWGYDVVIGETGAGKKQTAPPQ